jgi:CheY-like chemotaxis protein
MSRTILIVDDSKLARMAMVKAVRALRPGWVTAEAANSAEALSAVDTAAPDLAVVDFNMPGQDGLALAGELRARSPNMPLAVISANHQQEIISRARVVGASFLAKPLTEQALAEFLDAASLQMQTDNP